MPVNLNLRDVGLRAALRLLVRQAATIQPGLTFSNDGGMFVVMVRRDTPIAAERLRPPIALAIESGDLERVRLLLAEGIDANTRDTNGASLLLVAVASGRRPMAELLLEHGAKINAPDRSGETALIRSVRSFRPKQVELLLALKADPDKPDREGVTPLIHASYWAQGDLVTGEEQRAAEITRLLLRAGARVDAVDRDRTTALMRAAGWHHPAIVDQLLAARANVSLKDRHGRSALTWAARYGKDNLIVKTLLAKGARIELVDALLLGERKKAAELIKAGSSVTARGGFDETTLMVAAEQGYPEIVQALLARRVGVNAHDTEHLTALMVAVAGRPVDTMLGTRNWPEHRSQSDRLAILRMLLRAGANPKAANEIDETALSFAEEVGDREAMELLQRASK